MIAIGCLAPIILAVAGILLGNWLGGATWMLWGGGIGFVIGGAVLGFVGWLAGKLRE